MELSCTQKGIGIEIKLIIFKMLIIYKYIIIIKCYKIINLIITYLNCLKC